MELYTAHQIAGYMLVNKRSIQIRAKNENWPFTEVNGRGGKVRKYALADLPAHICVQIKETLIKETNSSAAHSGKAYLSVNEQNDRLKNSEINKDLCLIMLKATILSINNELLLSICFQTFKSSFKAIKNSVFE